MDAQTRSLQTADPALDGTILDQIRDLNRHISTTGERIEGNVCYWHETPAAIYAQEPPTADPDHMSKRANLAMLAKRHKSMVEIGLNGGHSALICLASNPDLHLFSVDIVGHGYTRLAADFLKSRFQRRFHFFAGDSREVMPRLAVEHPLLRFDLIHVDGGHGAALAFTDISNCLRMAEAEATLVFDDVNAPHLGDVLEAFIRMGRVGPSPHASSMFSNPLHDFVRVRPV